MHAPHRNRRLRSKARHLVFSMLCCGRRKEAREQGSAELSGVAVAEQPSSSGQVALEHGHGHVHGQRHGAGAGAQPAVVAPRRSSGGTRGRPGGAHQLPEMVVQSDFRKVSGISTEIFNQLQAVENDHDATTAASLEAVEKRGEMVVRILEPRALGKSAADAARRFLALADAHGLVRFVEIVKRPGQTLGLYIREGNGADRNDGVFISRIALESAVYNSGCLRVGDEVLAVNFVDVTRMSLDDVVIIMSIPRRLVLALRSRRGRGKTGPPPSKAHERKLGPPVVIFKKGIYDDTMDEPRERERERERDRDRDRDREQMEREYRHYGHEEQFLYYNSQPQSRYHVAVAAGGSPRAGPSGYAVPQPQPRHGARRQPQAPQAAPVVEQPRGGYPKTLESLAEKVHAFYEGSRPDVSHDAYETYGAYGVYGRPPPGQPRLQRHPSATSVRMLQAPRPTPAAVSVPRRGGGSGVQVPGGGGRLLRRTESDQRLSVLGVGRGYEYDPSGYWRRPHPPAAPPRPSLKSGHQQQQQGPAASMASMQARASSTAADRRYAHTVQRLHALRRRSAALDSASDTEVHVMPRGMSRQVSETATLGRYPSSLTVGGRTAARSYAQVRSNSLPRMKSGDEYRHPHRHHHHHQQPQQQHHHLVRFERSPMPQRHAHDSQEDSDGAVSAPELPMRRDRVRGMTSSPSVFTSEEYRAWLSRAPSTSAIYEKLRRSRDTLHTQRATRFTYSAENLHEHRDEYQIPYAYARRYGRHAKTSTTRSSRTLHTALPSAATLRAFAAAAAAAADGRRSGRAEPGSSATLHMPLPPPPPGPTPVPHPPTSASSSSLHRLRSTTSSSSPPPPPLLAINPAEFVRYRPDRESALLLGADDSEESFTGLLRIHLLGGRGLRSPGGGPGTSRDLYCVLECDRVHKARTVVRTGEQHFDWDEVFELDVLRTRQVDVLVYSWDPQFRHKLCFRGSLHLGTVLREAPAHRLALRLEPRGTLFLELRYTDPRQAFRRAPSSRPAVALFGVDLETVVARETPVVPVATVPTSTAPVSLILQRCIHEVERRGLDIIGLYRLCGSATKKRLLREAFERNPRLVDLSPDNVPDINVITGVLKDYLRELPEPLFTKCLYQMLVDALAVCLPDDPQGNAKLMFSILDCLPKVNRCTLIMLMDHLKLVTSQSDRNKMDAQNLAVCFGPVLMVHADPTTSSMDFQRPVEVLKYLLEIWPTKSDGGASCSGGVGAPESVGDVGTQKVVTWVGQRVLPESSC